MSAPVPATPPPPLPRRRRARRAHAGGEEGVDSWLMSYADMITLLMSFFVIFVATSEPKQERLKAATQGMKERFGTAALESPYDAVYRDVLGMVAADHAESVVATQKTPKGVTFELAALSFFAPGSVEIPADRQAMLQEIVQRLNEAKIRNYNVEVEAYTSDIPPAPYVSAWELAAARAGRITGALAEAGIPPERLSAASYGATRPAVPNRDAGGEPIPENQARNERVVIRVEQR